MLLGFSDALSDRARAKRSCGGFLQFISDCCLCLVFPVLVPALYVFRYLRGSANVSRRYLSKYWKRNRDPIAPKTTHPKPWTRGPPSASEKVAPIPPHLPLELVTMITKDLHYADLLNIGCSSKYLRTVFFANHNPRQGAQKLRQFVCKDGQPLENCAICRIQICSVRSTSFSQTCLIGNINTFYPGLSPRKICPGTQRRAAPNRMPTDLSPMLLQKELCQEEEEARKQKADLFLWQARYRDECRRTTAAKRGKTGPHRHALHRLLQDDAGGETGQVGEGEYARGATVGEVAAGLPYV